MACLYMTQFEIYRMYVPVHEQFTLNKGKIDRKIPNYGLSTILSPKFRFFLNGPNFGVLFTKMVPSGRYNR